MRDRNLEIWQRGSLTREYAGRTELYAGESRFLADYRDELRAGKFLDIGVGGGRTTWHFASAVREYIGVDYSHSMVAAARQSFAGRLENAQFQWADARDLSAFPAGEFDAVIFSFNGVDTLEPEERNQFFLEARRVLKGGGLLAFSSHNLCALNQVFRFKRAKSLSGLVAGTKRKLIQTIRNPPLPELMARDWAMVYDGTHGKLLRHYYVKPPFQMAALAALGFSDIRLIETIRGDEIAPDSPEAHLARWPYYFCRSPGGNRL